MRKKGPTYTSANLLSMSHIQGQKELCCRELTILLKFPSVRKASSSICRATMSAQLKENEQKTVEGTAEHICHHLQFASGRDHIDEVNTTATVPWEQM